MRHIDYVPKSNSDSNLGQSQKVYVTTNMGQRENIKTLKLMTAMSQKVLFIRTLLLGKWRVDIHQKDLL